MATIRAPVAPSLEARRAAVGAALKSGTFRKNPRLAALLEYLCLKSLRGQASSVKEYDIAIDVFGRDADFDQSTDAIVRVEMHRLRKKLKEFYAGEGQDEPLEIIIHSGQYLPEFVFRQTVPVPAKEPTRISPALVWLAAALVAVLATVMVLWPKRAVERPGLSQPQSAAPSPVPAVPASDAVRILCGSSKSGYRDRQGNVWGADQYYSGGSAIHSPGTPVYRTRDASLFQESRSGEFSYKIPLRPGVYELRIFFVDSAYAPGLDVGGGDGLRVFSILLNGEILIRDLDILSEAGPNTADVRVFKDVHPASDGYLHLSFVKQQGAPLVNAIEIIPGTPHRQRPIRIVTQDAPITDNAGLTWSPDNYFFGGRVLARFASIAGSEDPRLYASERYGNFSYAIPLSPGRYRLGLRFAEAYWGANLPGGGGIGARVFDVYCNGTALLRNFDMFKEAGPRRQITKTFHNLQPNAQGTLLLSFIPIKNYADISAIEVTPETP